MESNRRQAFTVSTMLPMSAHLGIILSQKTATEDFAPIQEACVVNKDGKFLFVDNTGLCFLHYPSQEGNHMSHFSLYFLFTAMLHVGAYSGL
jgi:hypothetical protein